MLKFKTCLKLNIIIRNGKILEKETLLTVPQAYRVDMLGGPLARFTKMAVLMSKLLNNKHKMKMTLSKSIYVSDIPLLDRYSRANSYNLNDQHIKPNNKNYSLPSLVGFITLWKKRQYPITCSRSRLALKFAHRCMRCVNVGANTNSVFRFVQPVLGGVGALGTWVVSITVVFPNSIKELSEPS